MTPDQHAAQMTALTECLRRPAERAPTLSNDAIAAQDRDEQAAEDRKAEREGAYMSAREQDTLSDRRAAEA